MLPFSDHDTHYALAAGGVHSLPGGRRLGIVSIRSPQVVIAFVGTDPEWTGGITLRIGDTVHRGGLALQLVQVGHDWLGRRTAEFEITCCATGKDHSVSRTMTRPPAPQNHPAPRAGAGQS